MRKKNRPLFSLLRLETRFKRDETAEAALKQIDSKDYALPFAADSRKVIKIGVSFDSQTRKLVGWEAV